jgi:hypothetical protein
MVVRGLERIPGSLELAGRELGTLVTGLSSLEAHHAGLSDDCSFEAADLELYVQSRSKQGV